MNTTFPFKQWLAIIQWIYYSIHLRKPITLHYLIYCNSLQIFISRQRSIKSIYFEKLPYNNIKHIEDISFNYSVFNHFHWNNTKIYCFFQNIKAILQLNFFRILQSQIKTVNCIKHLCMYVYEREKESVWGVCRLDKSLVQKILVS